MVTTADDWRGRVGATWAEEWRRTDRSFAPVDAALLARAAAALGGRRQARVLDIGCGAGTTALNLAGALPAATVTGIDLSPELVAVARARADGRCRFEVADAALWAGDAGFDLLVSRHGVMFFADPVAAFAHLRTRAAPDAPLVFSCFRSPAENGWASGIAALLPPPERPDPHAPGPFAFADPARVADVLAAAGWRDAAPAPLDFDYVAGAGDDPVADAVGFFGRIGPSAFAMRHLAGAARDALVAGLTALAKRHRDRDRVVFPAAAWLWSARA